jgi:hypothetical protein
VHTSILDLQNLLNTHPKPQIIALTETKHRHIKSIWRHTLKSYKLIYNPSLYNKKTKCASGGAILAIRSDAYTTIEPIHVPTPYQPHLAIALLQPGVGTPLITMSSYLPQPTTAQGKLEYQAIFHWIAKLLYDEYPRHPILMGGDL